MAIFAMPIVLMIEADSVEDAQKNIDDWFDEVDYDTLPIGVEDIEHNPHCDHNDEGQRLLYLSNPDGMDEDITTDDEDDGGEDDFNDAEHDFI